MNENLLPPRPSDILGSCLQVLRVVAFQASACPLGQRKSRTEFGKGFVRQFCGFLWAVLVAAIPSRSCSVSPLPAQRWASCWTVQSDLSVAIHRSNLPTVSSLRCICQCSTRTKGDPDPVCLSWLQQEVVQSRHRGNPGRVLPSGRVEECHHRDCP